jgi:4a-hydroxytetrahydrobiopterin dehydratase
MPLWKLKESGQISRQFVSMSFSIAMEFLNSVANLAEEKRHHPDLHLTSYRNVEV